MQRNALSHRLVQPVPKQIESFIVFSFAEWQAAPDKTPKQQCKQQQQQRTLEEAVAGSRSLTITEQHNKTPAVRPAALVCRAYRNIHVQIVGVLLLFIHRAHAFACSAAAPCLHNVCALWRPRRKVGWQLMHARTHAKSKTQSIWGRSRADAIRTTRYYANRGRSAKRDARSNNTISTQRLTDPHNKYNILHHDHQRAECASHQTAIYYVQFEIWPNRSPAAIRTFVSFWHRHRDPGAALSVR